MPMGYACTLGRRPLARNLRYMVYRTYVRYKYILDLIDDGNSLYRGAGVIERKSLRRDQTCTRNGLRFFAGNHFRHAGIFACCGRRAKTCMEPLAHRSDFTMMS